MRVAVTGATGLIGEALVIRLQARNEVLAIARRARASSTRLTWARADLADGRSVEKALLDFGAQCVVHAGALTDVDACERDPELAARVNLGGTEQVARACRALGARLVTFSTGQVFDGAKGDYAEDDAPCPIGVYGRTKRDAEHAALTIAPDCAVARVAVVYSGRTGARSTFATQVLEKLGRGETVRAFADQVISPTLAESAAEMACELLLETSHRGILHACGATALTRLEFAQRIAIRFGLDPSGIVAIRAAEAGHSARRPLLMGLRADRAAALLRNRPLPIDAALDRFRAQRLQGGAAAREGPIH